jgi:hypothetical protein
VDFVFSFVRHPLKFYTSVWRYVKKMRLKGKQRLDYWRPWWPTLEVVRNWDDDFHTWVCCMLEAQPSWATRLFEQYVGPEHGEFCHFIGRQETLAEDFCQVMSMIGYGDVIDKHRDRIHARRHINAVSPKRVDRVAWSYEAETAVRDSERLIIRRFYSKENWDRRCYGSLALSEQHRKRCSPFSPIEHEAIRSIGGK